MGRSRGSLPPPVGHHRAGRQRAQLLSPGQHPAAALRFLPAAAARQPPGITGGREGACACRACQCAGPALLSSTIADPVHAPSLACCPYLPSLSFLPLVLSLPLPQFKQPLVGSIRSLALSCSCELRPLSQAVAHAALCPCHSMPASWAGPTAAPLCSISGTPLDRRQCGRDERTVQVGGSAAGALHLSAPFNIAAVAGTAGGGPVTLSVLARIKVGAGGAAELHC